MKLSCVVFTISYLFSFFVLSVKSDDDFINLPKIFKTTANHFVFNTADSHKNQDELPKEFNAAKTWYKCRPIIEHIDNQLFTLTCLHFGLTHVLADRFCIETDGKVIVSLSAWDLISCCPERKNIAQFLWEKGVTTGGSIWDADSGCRPFEIEKCSHKRIETPYNNFPSSCFQDDSSAEVCILTCVGRLSTTCTTECVQKRDNPLRFYVNGSSSELNYGMPIIYGTDIEQAMMREIIKNGPIFTAMTHTLNNYTGGIIRDVQATFKEGWHGVRITGWGVENGTRYWLAANSYGHSFGENGWIRIERGRNLMGIERFVFAPRPDLKRLPDTVKKNGWKMNLTYVEGDKSDFDNPAMTSLNNLINLIL